MWVYVVSSPLSGSFCNFCRNIAEVAICSARHIEGLMMCIGLITGDWVKPPSTEFPHHGVAVFSFAVDEYVGGDPLRAMRGRVEFSYSLWRCEAVLSHPTQMCRRMDESSDVTEFSLKTYGPLDSPDMDASKLKHLAYVYWNWVSVIWNNNTETGTRI